MKGVDVGREYRADYSLVAKFVINSNIKLQTFILRAYARIASCYAKQEKLKEALNFYEKSLSEHRDPEVVKKHKEFEKKFKDIEKLAYVNPEISDAEKNKGNDLFKKGERHFIDYISIA